MNEGVARRIIRTLSMVLNRALVVVLCLPLAMGCYALWDSHMVYERANVEQWQPYKPTEPEPLSFWELQRINPEVRAWLSVYGTNIDYPVCQAAQGSEDKYVTTNAKGEYSLSGALFMDTANAADFSDPTFPRGSSSMSTATATCLRTTRITVWSSSASSTRMPTTGASIATRSQATGRGRAT